MFKDCLGKWRYMEIQYCHFEFWSAALFCGADESFEVYCMGGEL